MKSRIIFAISALVMLLYPFAFSVFSTSSVYAASITLDPSSGTVGTLISVSGEGFSGSFATIHWDNQIIAKDVPISESGKLNHALEVPLTYKGEHTILISDDSNWTASTASIAFTVLPHIRIFPRMGQAWTITTIIGNGFASDEKGIIITWDGSTTSNAPIRADRLGKWSTHFNIPSAEKGDHFIGAFGNITESPEVVPVSFILTPLIKVKPLSGPVGTEITIDGIGFRISEDGITITYDNEMIKYNLVSGTDGSWSTTLNIPPSTQGHHTIGVYGSSFTPRGVVPSITFEVIPHIKLDPASGNKGTQTTITGTGFSKDETITLSLDTITLNKSGIVTDNTGSFTATLEVPQSKNKELLINATGSSDNSAEASFTLEATSPQAPELSSPVQGAKLEIFDSVGSVFLGTTKYIAGIINYYRGHESTALISATATLDWTSITTSDDISYILQITRDNDFSSPIILKDTADSEYTLSEREFLTSGSYSWRVKATDAIGNESPWSKVQEFEVISMSNQVIILSILSVVLSVALIVFGIFIWRVNRPNV